MLLYVYIYISVAILVQALSRPCPRRAWPAEHWLRAGARTRSVNGGSSGLRRRRCAGSPNPLLVAPREVARGGCCPHLCPLRGEPRRRRHVQRARMPIAGLSSGPHGTCPRWHGAGRPQRCRAPRAGGAESTRSRRRSPPLSVRSAGRRGRPALR